MAKITFIDDEHNAMDFYVSALRQSGFDVEHIDTVEGALMHINESDGPSDMYIVDLMMPPGNALDPEEVAFGLKSGIEIHRQIRERWSSVPVIVLSSVSNPSILDAVPFDENTSREAKIDVLPFQLVELVRSRLRIHATTTSDTNEVSAKLSVESAGAARPSDTEDRQRWREIIHGIKQEAVRKFLAEPEHLTPSEFLLLSDLSHAVIRSIAREDEATPQGSPTTWMTTNAALLDQLMTSTRPHLRGKSLEELTVRLFNSVPGFRAKARLKTKTEEIDLFVLNGSNEAPWRDMGPALIGECKKWSAKCGTEEFDHFESKVRNRSGQCRCGFFISWNGFTAPFGEQRLRASRENFIIVLLEGKHLKEAVAKANFPEVLCRLWERAVLL